MLIIYNRRQVRQLKEKQVQESQNQKKFTDEQYRFLLDRQFEKNKIASESGFGKSSRRPALGRFQINYILVKPPGLPDDSINSLIRNLKNNSQNPYTDCAGERCRANISLAYVNSYLMQEAVKYRVDNFYLQSVIHGPYSLTKLTKIGDMMNLWGKDPFGLSKLKDTFEALILENDIPIGKNDLVVFLYFDSSRALDRYGSDERFYDYKTFRSFADREKSRIYINVYSFSPFFSKEVATIAGHEILHLFGAVDKYHEPVPTGGDICGEEGRGDTGGNAPMPQATGDIMCLHVEKGKGIFSRGNLAEKNLVVNTITASEIGWARY